MIIGTASRGQTEMLILGLSHMNLEKLKAGQPMHLTHATHGGAIPKDLEIVIIHGATEEHMEAQFHQLGLIGDDTQIKKQPPNEH